MNNNRDLKLFNEDFKFIIQTLDDGLLEHSKCLKELHQSLLCGLPISDVYFFKDGYRQCEFGKWYFSQTSQYLSNNEHFALINELHRSMHDNSRVLALKVKLGDTITKDDYDKFMDKERDLSKLLLKLRDEFLETMFKIDCLTGVPTREPFFEILKQEISRAGRTSQSGFITMVDLDHLKDINDSYGHLTGDTVLKESANYLSSHLRPYDSICRYGGDEFLICLPHTTLDMAREIVGRLQVGFSSHLIAIDDENGINVTASFGVTSLVSETSINAIIERVDEALYMAKRYGGNQIRLWEDKG